MTVREFLIAFGPRVTELSRDVQTMSAPAFRRKHGVDVRECRAKLKRLKELSSAGRGADVNEVRELVGLFSAVLTRRAN